jgi:chemotaxis protein MotB
VKNPSVIIIKKPKRGGHGGHHGGAWKVAYADFVTAMMAFFLVMWLVAQNDVVKASVAGYFSDPGLFDNQKSNSLIAGGDLRLDSAKRTPVDVELASRQILEQAAERLKASLNGLPEFQRLESQVEMQLTAEGLRIELLEGDRATFFDSGSARLRTETEHLLGAIATELGKLENSVVVEGHTDSTPYSASRTYTNWELSADRANAARRVMESLGLPAGQVRAVRGFADRQLRVPDAPNDPRNRRVSIVVQHLGLEAIESMPPGGGQPQGTPPGAGALPAATAAAPPTAPAPPAPPAH